MPAPAPHALDAPPAQVPGDRTRGLSRVVCAVVVALLAAHFAYQGLRVVALPGEQIVASNVVIDDGFYYLQVARNLARGYGSTFDRINRTNGYQPLWALALVPIYWCTDDEMTGMKAVLVLAVLFSVAGMLLLYAGLQRMVGLGTALAVSAVISFSPYFPGVLMMGMETPMLLATTGGLVAYWALRAGAVFAGRRRACIVLGLLLAAVILSRVDTTFILVPFGVAVVVWGGGRPRQRLRRALLVAAPVALLVGAYSLWNLLEHGSIIPVSGQVKGFIANKFTPDWKMWVYTEQWRGITRTLHEGVWPWVLHEREALDRMPTLLAIPVLAVAALSLRLVWSRRARANTRAALLLSASFAGVVAHGLYMVFYYRACGHWNYHYFFPFVLLYLTVTLAAPALLLADLALLLDRALRGRLRRGLAALGVCLSLPFVAYCVHRGGTSAELRYNDIAHPPRQSFRELRLRAARRMRSEFPPDTVFAAWWAGTTGYFSDRPVINLDGVINSGHYFRRYLLEDDVSAYLLRDGPAQYIADYFWRDPLTSGANRGWRIFWWEYEKHYLCYVLRDRLEIVYKDLYRAEAGFYILRIVKTAPR